MDASKVVRFGNEPAKGGAGSVSGDKSSFILRQSAAAQDGVLIAFKAYFHNKNRFSLQIWRKDSGDDYKLIHDFPYTPTNGNGIEEVSIIFLQIYFLICVS